MSIGFTTDQWKGASCRENNGGDGTERLSSITGSTGRVRERRRGSPASGSNGALLLLGSHASAIGVQLAGSRLGLGRPVSCSLAGLSLCESPASTIEQAASNQGAECRTCRPHYLISRPHATAGIFSITFSCCCSQVVQLG